MRFRALLVAGAAVLPGACASGATSAEGPAPAEPAAAPAGSALVYDLPSPPMATYEVSDTLVTIMSVAGNDMDMTMGSSATVELTFERDEAGLAVSGSVLAFGSSMTSPMTPPMTSSLEDLEGDLDFVLGPQGEVEVGSLPASSNALAPVTTFMSLANELFPRFPDGPVAAGDMWADTLDASLEDAEVDEALADAGIAGLADIGADGITITTYTLAGDTVVAGRTLLHITMTTEGVMAATGEVEGQDMSQDMVNVTEGSFLWDPERRLIVVAEVARTIDGTMMMQDMAMTMTAAGTLRLRLVN